MLLKNTSTRYGVITKTFHWVMALLVILMLMLGLYMTDVTEMATKLMLYNRHKSLGVLVLLLAMGRIGWHLYSRRPDFVASLKSYEKAGAHVLHMLLYVCMVGMPLSGWLMSSAAGRAVSFFGLFTLPDLVAQDKDLGGVLRNVHEYMAYGLIALVCGHFAAALKHHFIDRDATLRRMLPFGGAAVFAVLLLLAQPARAADPTYWSEVAAESTVTFSQNGGGALPVLSYKTDIAFEPGMLSSSHIAFYVDLTNAYAEPGAYAAPELRQSMELASSMAVLKTTGPGSAVFKSTGIRKQGNGYLVEGSLEMNGRSKSMQIPVDARIVSYFDLPKLVLVGQFTFDPRDFASATLVVPESLNNVTVAFTFNAIPG